MNVDSAALTDPRMRRLAYRLGMHWRQAFGHLISVWMLAYDRRSCELTREDVDIAAEYVGFSDAMVSADLAEISSKKHEVIRVRGVKERIEFLKAQQKRGLKGGRPKNQRLLEEKANGFEKTNQRLLEEKANSLSLSLSLDQSLRERDPDLAACAAPSNPADAAEGSGGPQNQTAPAQAPSRSRKAAGTAANGLLLPLPGPDNPQEKTAATAQPIASGEVSQNATVTAKWFDRFERQTGAKPTWGKEAGAQLKRLLGIHSAEELCRRIDNAFDAPPYPHTPPADFLSFVRGVDKYATRHGGVQVKPIQQQPRPYQLVPRVYGGDK